MASRNSSVSEIGALRSSAPPSDEEGVKSLVWDALREEIDGRAFLSSLPDAGRTGILGKNIGFTIK